MSTTDAAGETATQTGGTVPMKLEVAVLPVSDVDRAKAFYQGLGWRLDADFSSGEDFRVVQLTPPASQASVIFGKGITSAWPGSIDSFVLVVSDIEAARDALSGHGVQVSEVFHDVGGVFHHAGTEGRVPGADPQGHSYATWASFSDPDGNGWMLQEITQRLPGREWGEEAPVMDVPELADLLNETAEHHGHYEATHEPHNWWDWYAAYMHARQSGSDSSEAAGAADRYMEEVHHVHRR